MERRGEGYMGMNGRELRWRCVWRRKGGMRGMDGGRTPAAGGAGGEGSMEGVR